MPFNIANIWIQNFVPMFLSEEKLEETVSTWVKEKQNNSVEGWMFSATVDCLSLTNYHSNQQNCISHNSGGRNSKVCYWLRTCLGSCIFISCLCPLTIVGVEKDFGISATEMLIQFVRSCSTY